MVPVLWLAQATGIIPAGAGLLRFDAHLDASELRTAAAGRISEVSSLAEAFVFAQHELSDIDDDWLSLALASGMVGNCLVIGPDEKALVDNPYQDRIKVVRTLDALSDNGGLSDETALASATSLTSSDRELSTVPLLLDIDCDYFSFRWRTTQHAWLDKFYEREFDSSPDCHKKPSHCSNHLLMTRLIEQSPFVTIAVEPDFCGGPSEAREIVGQLNRRFFKGAIDLDRIACLKTAF